MDLQQANQIYDENVQIFNIVAEGMTQKVQDQKEMLAKELAEIKKLIKMREQLMMLHAQNTKAIGRYSRHCVNTVNEHRANVV